MIRVRIHAERSLRRDDDDDDDARGRAVRSMGDDVYRGTTFVRRARVDDDDEDEDEDARVWIWKSIAKRRQTRDDDDDRSEGWFATPPRLFRAPSVGKRRTAFARVRRRRAGKLVRGRAVTARTDS